MHNLEDVNWEEFIVNVSRGIPSQLPFAKWEIDLDEANAILRFHYNKEIDRFNQNLQLVGIIVKALGVKDWEPEPIPRTDEENITDLRGIERDEELERKLSKAGIPIYYVSKDNATI